MVMVLFSLAEKLEALSLDRARNAIDSLLDLSPETALALQADGSWKLQDARTLGPGSVIRVGPGERVSHDGIVIRGHSAMDQSAITGESLPAEKAPGDGVFAGAVNRHGEIQVRVSASSDSSTLARIIHLVREAQSSRSATERFIDRFAKAYTPAVMALALIVAVAPPLLAGASWAVWAYRAPAPW
jgi:Cd2+/Zn2+-exporting ATPase